MYVCMYVCMIQMSYYKVLRYELCIYVCMYAVCTYLYVYG